GATYGAMTIQKALEGRTKYWEPGKSHDEDNEKQPEQKQEQRRGWQWDLITSADFINRVYHLEWKIKRLVVGLQGLTFGGLLKTLKTTIAVDAVVSLGTQTPFLGKFDVYKRTRVAIISGESGGHALQNTFRRICDARDVNPADADILWGFTLPS